MTAHATPTPPVRVLQVLRRPFATGYYSVEVLFGTVRAHLPADIEVEAVMVPRLSQGLANRLVNVAWMRAYRSPVTHIAGDVTYLAAALPRRGTLVTILDTGWHERSWLSRRMFDLAWLRMPVARAERVTVISEAVREAVLEITRVDPAKVTVVPCCVDPAFVPRPAAANGGPPIVLQVGTSPNKNVERTAAALAGLDCELHVVGPLSPSQRDAIARHRVRHRVSVNLSQSQIVRAYQEAAVVVFASTFEGFGVPIIEAQSVGCPVVTSRLAPMADVAGDGACLVDPHDVESIRDGVRRALEDTAYRAQLRQRGAANAAHYSASAIAERYASLYREMAGP
jgi:glycosyltransferase involved in cell wall biosynthesis